MTRGFTKLISSISYLAKVLTRRFRDINARKQVVKEEATRVPTFYGAEALSYSDSKQWIIAFFFSIIFGVVHYLAGSFSPFPTSTERHVWLVSSSAILIVPCLFANMPNLSKNDPILTTLFLGIYILARTILFVLGFTTLRGLPPEAFNTIHWPHFIFIFIGN